MISLDPRTKVILFVVLFALVFIVTGFYYFLTLIIIAFIITLFNKNEKRFLKSLVKFIPVLLIAFIMWSLFHNWSLFHINDTENSGVNIGILMTVRLLTLFSISLSFLLTIRPEELIKALEALNFPYTIAFTLGLALRYVDTISEEYNTIKEAQTSRGLELDSGFLLKRIKNYTYVLIPLLVRSIETAEKLVFAMELRAFSLRKKQHKITYKLKLLDYILITFSLIILSLSIAYYILKVI
ncbi:MAG: energy-coupling factor transporter transmembrane component T [Thermoprotei archaeon]